MPRLPADVPFAPRRWPFFYGWMVLFAGTVGILCSVPGQTVGVSAFTDPLIAALGIDRTALSTTYMVGTILSALLMTRAGRLYDRFGGRAAGVLAGVSLGIVLLGLSQMDWLLATALRPLPPEGARWALLGGLTLGFFLLRFTGQGVLTMASRNMVMEWFETRRGRVNGVLSVFIGVGFSMAPPVFDRLIQAYAWDGAWGRMGIFLLVGFSLFALVFYRDHPEGCGLLPDGMPGRERSAAASEAAWTLEEARRTWCFWVFNLATALMALYITALTFHVVSIFELAGQTRAQAISIFLPGSVISVVISLGGGVLSDRVPLKYLLMVMMVGFLLSCAGLVWLSLGWTRWVMIAGNGLSMGCFGVLLAMTWPTFFGRKHLGAISGYNLAWVVFFSAVGPLLFSLSRDWTGRYTVCAAGVAVLAGLLLGAAVRADAPVRGGGGRLRTPW